MSLEKGYELTRRLGTSTIKIHQTDSGEGRTSRGGQEAEFPLHDYTKITQSKVKGLRIVP